jgi:hypothetical protein
MTGTMSPLTTSRPRQAHHDTSTTFDRSALIRQASAFHTRRSNSLVSEVEFRASILCIGYGVRGIPVAFMFFWLCPAV